MKVTIGEKHDRQLSKWITLGVASSVLFLASQANQGVTANADTGGSTTSSSNTGTPTTTMPNVNNIGLSLSSDGEFTVSGNNWTQVSANSNYSIIAYDVTKDSTGDYIYHKDSKLVLLFNSDEDLSNGSFALNADDGTGDYDSGSFTTTKVGGKIYSGVYLDSGMIKDIVQKNIAGHTSTLKLTNGPSTVSDSLKLNIDEQLTVNLPTQNEQTDGQNASTFLVGQSVSLSDNFGDDNIAAYTLTADDITMKADGSSTGSYEYYLSTTGRTHITKLISEKSIKNSFVDLSAESTYGQFELLAQGASTTGSSSTSSAASTDGSTSSSNPSTTSNDNGSGTDTESTGGNSVPTADTYTYTINYVNNLNRIVDTKVITGTAKSNQTIDYNDYLPSGYEIASGQATSDDHYFDKDHTINIKVVVSNTLVSGTVEYVDQNNNQVTTDALKVASGALQLYSVTVPSGYVLASGQRTSVPFIWTNADSSKNTLIIHLIKLATQDYGTTTVNYVDADNGKTLDSESFTGIVGTRVPFDTSTIVSRFLKEGYLVQSNGTLATAWYTTQGQTLTVVLKKQATTKTVTPKSSGRVVLPSTMKQPASQTTTKSGNNSTTPVASATPSSTNGTSTTPMSNASTGTVSTGDASLPSASAPFVTLTDDATPSTSDAATPSTAESTPQTTADTQNTSTNETTPAQQKAAEAAATQQRQITAARKAAAAKRAAHERVQREALKQFEDANERDQFQHQSVAFSDSGHSHQHGDGGPAGGGDSFTELAKYFSVLSGKINFGR